MVSGVRVRLDQIGTTQGLFDLESMFYTFCYLESIFHSVILVLFSSFQLTDLTI